MESRTSLRLRFSCCVNSSHSRSSWSLTCCRPRRIRSLFLWTAWSAKAKAGWATEPIGCAASKPWYRTAQVARTGDPNRLDRGTPRPDPDTGAGRSNDAASRVWQVGMVRHHPGRREGGFKGDPRPACGTDTRDRVGGVSSGSFPKRRIAAARFRPLHRSLRTANRVRSGGRFGSNRRSPCRRWWLRIWPTGCRRGGSPARISGFRARKAPGLRRPRSRRDG